VTRCGSRRTPDRETSRADPLADRSGVSCACKPSGDPARGHCLPSPPSPLSAPCCCRRRQQTYASQPELCRCSVIDRSTPAMSALYCQLPGRMVGRISEIGTHVTVGEQALVTKAKLKLTDDIKVRGCWLG